MEFGSLSYADLSNIAIMKHYCMLMSRTSNNELGDIQFSSDNTNDTSIERAIEDGLIEVEFADEEVSTLCDNEIETRIGKKMAKARMDKMKKCRGCMDDSHAKMREGMDMLDELMNELMKEHDKEKEDDGPVEEAPYPETPAVYAQDEPDQNLEIMNRIGGALSAIESSLALKVEQPSPTKSIEGDIESIEARLAGVLDAIKPTQKTRVTSDYVKNVLKKIGLSEE